jgi:diguanylate cyclase (GGDEF)-like protein
MPLYLAPPRTLKARVSLLTLCIVVASLLSLGWYCKQLLREELLRFVGEQQHSALNLLNGQVTQGVQDRLNTLQALAAHLPPQALQDKAVLQRFLQDQPHLAGFFNGSVLAWNLRGKLQAEVRYLDDAWLAQAIDPHDLAAVLQGRQPHHVGARVHGRMPFGVVSLVVPLHDDQGRLRGALGGVMRLDQPNFLGPLTAKPYGKSGNFFVIDPRQRLIFATSDKARLLEVLPAPGISPWIDRFMQGFEGSARVVNPHGVEVLVTVQQIPVAGWYASVTLSPEEAFSLIQAIVPRGRWAALALSLLCLGLIWWMLQRQLAPMSAAVQTLEGFVNGNQAPQALPVARPDEIGQLVGGFNRLLEMLTLQQRSLLQSELFKQAVLNSVTAEIAVLDAAGVILAVNDAWRHAATDRATATEQRLEQGDVGVDYLAASAHLVAELHAADGLSVSDGIRGVLRGTLPRFHMEYPCDVLRPSCWQSISVTPLKGESLRGAVVCIEDITERVHMQNQVRELAFYDPLTRLPNRRLVLDRLAQHMVRSRRESIRLALLFIDLDRFKQVNDEQGHGTGDWLLQAVAQRIQHCLRESDTPARIGGDEFLVVLPDLHSPDAAMGVADKIRFELEQGFLTPQGQTLHISSSIGVALYPDHGATEKDLLHVGDAAMYRAKKSGRNTVLMGNPMDGTPPRPAKSFANIGDSPH